MDAAIGYGRWMVKKAARVAIGLASAAGALPGVVGGGRANRIRVLTYHRFGQARQDPFCLSADAFASQMNWLASNGLAVSLADVVAFMAGTKDLPDGSVLVTMDDGDPGVAEIAQPILAHYKVPAVAFVVAGAIGQPNHLDERQLRALPAAGIEIGSHSATHRSMAKIPPAEAMREIAGSRARLEDVLGMAVTSFAYPYGTLGDFNDDVAGMLAESGYTMAFTSQHGALKPGLAPMTLPRIKVEAGDPDWLFPLLCAGGLDAWRLVDRTLWQLQKPAAQA